MAPKLPRAWMWGVIAESSLLGVEARAALAQLHRELDQAMSLTQKKEAQRLVDELLQG